MEIPEEISKQIQDLQVYEQNLQALLMQKQAIQIELNEVSNALGELSKSSEEVYKIVGGIMVKSDKKTLVKELEEKKKLSEIRLQSLEKQEKSLEEKATGLREEIQKALSAKK